jgi:anti-sigma factor RsiW
VNCEQIGELLPDYFQGGLSSQKKEIVDMHLAECGECRDEVAVWKKLALLPVEQPSEESRMRFAAMLHEHRETQTAKRKAGTERETRAAGWSFWQWLRTPVGAVAWSAALLLIGILVGGRFGVGSVSKPPQNDEMAQMHNELTNMRQLVVLSMLQQQSASERLQGVSWSSGAEQLDPQVSAALLHTLRYDGSVDVRLAALDALSKHSGQPQVRRGVLEALQGQQSPLVQVALIDQLVEWRDPDAAQHLRNFERTPDLNPAVKQRAEWAVSKLN